MKTNFFKRLAPFCAGAMALAAATLTGCDGMEEPTGLGVQHVEQEGVVAATGGEFLFTVRPGSMDDWTLTFLDAEGREQTTLDWVSLSKASGSGKTDVTATVAANTLGRQRTAKIVVNAGDRKVPIPIVQAANPYFRVTPEELLGLPASEGGEYIARTLEVESNIEWYAVIVHDDETEAPWVSFLPDKAATHAAADAPAEGDASLDLRIENWEQLLGDSRTAKVRFYSPDGALLQEVPISQETMFSDPDLIIFHVTPEELLGLPANEGGEYLARTLEVESNIRWYAVIVHDDGTAEPWVSFLPGNGATHASEGDPAEGDASLDLRIENWDQVDGDPRTAKVRFYSPDGTLLQEVPISQNPLESYFRVTPSDLTGLPWSEGGSNFNRTLTVESNMTWYAVLTRQSDPVWVQFTGSTDNYGGPYAEAIDGDARIGLDIDNWLEYVTTPPRTATVTFYDSRDGAVLATVPVSQNPRPWLRIDKQPERLGREHNAYFENTLVPPGWGGSASSHDLTVAATLFNSNEPITYTWYYNGTRTTDDDTVEGGTPMPVDLTSDGGKTLTVTYQLLREKYSWGGFFYCVVSSPGAESVISETIELWCVADGLG